MRKTLLAILIVLLPPCIWAKDPPERIEPTTFNGNLALKFFDDHTTKDFSIVELGGTDAAPVFIFHVEHLHWNNCPGLLIVSAKRVHWAANCEPNNFDVPSSEAIITTSGRDWQVHVEASGEKYQFLGTRLSAGRAHTSVGFFVSIWMIRFLMQTVQDFPAAEGRFWQLRGEKPPAMAQAIDDAFRAQAAAWRALAVKPELPEEARKQRLLAESYLREKDFKGSIEHYELGVKAAPTWPEGWFNLALLYGETGEYALAADRMKHYLELLPNSPDAAAARDKIVIWEDKASRK